MNCHIIISFCVQKQEWSNADSGWGSNITLYLQKEDCWHVNSEYLFPLSGQRAAVPYTHLHWITPSLMTLIITVTNRSTNLSFHAHTRSHTVGWLNCKQWPLSGSPPTMCMWDLWKPALIFVSRISSSYLKNWNWKVRNCAIEQRKTSCKFHRHNTTACVCVCAHVCYLSYMLTWNFLTLSHEATLNSPLKTHHSVRHKLSISTNTTHPHTDEVPLEFF